MYWTALRPYSGRVANYHDPDICLPNVNETLSHKHPEKKAPLQKAAVPTGRPCKNNRVGAETAEAEAC